MLQLKVNHKHTSFSFSCVTTKKKPKQRALEKLWEVRWKVWDVNEMWNGREMGVKERGGKSKVSVPANGACTACTNHTHTLTHTCVVRAARAVLLFSSVLPHCNFRISFIAFHQLFFASIFFPTYFDFSLITPSMCVVFNYSCGPETALLPSNFCCDCCSCCCCSFYPPPPYWRHLHLWPTTGRMIYLLPGTFSSANTKWRKSLWEFVNIWYFFKEIWIFKLN